MGTRARRGQAFVEMAFGLFALALVLSATFAFAQYIVRSMDAMRTYRASAGRRAMGMIGEGRARATVTDEMEIDPFPADNIFGTRTMKVRETVAVPAMGFTDDVIPPPFQ